MGNATTRGLVGKVRTILPKARHMNESNVLATALDKLDSLTEHLFQIIPVVYAVPANRPLTPKLLISTSVFTDLIYKNRYLAITGDISLLRPACVTSTHNYS